MTSINAPAWRRSSLCNADACVEVAAVTVLGEPFIAIRDSKDESNEVLTTEADFARFLAGAKRGDFDHLVSR